MKTEEQKTDRELVFCLCVCVCGGEVWEVGEGGVGSGGGEVWEVGEGRCGKWGGEGWGGGGVDGEVKRCHL